MRFVSKMQLFNNTKYFLRKCLGPIQPLNQGNILKTIVTDINSKEIEVNRGKNEEKKIPNATPKKKKPNGLQKDCELKGPLKEFLNIDKASKIFVLKYTWKYIKENNLQNPNKKRQIIPDEKLKQVLDKNEVDMLEMPKLLFKHMSKISEEQTTVS